MGTRPRAEVAAAAGLRDGIMLGGRRQGGALQLLGSAPLGAVLGAAGSLLWVFAFVLCVSHPSLLAGPLQGWPQLSVQCPQPDVPCRWSHGTRLGSAISARAGRDPKAAAPGPLLSGQIGSRTSAETGNASATSWGWGPGRAPGSLPGPTAIKATRCRGWLERGLPRRLSGKGMATGSRGTTPARHLSLSLSCPTAEVPSCRSPTCSKSGLPGARRCPLGMLSTVPVPSCSQPVPGSRAGGGSSPDTLGSMSWGPGGVGSPPHSIAGVSQSLPCPVLSRSTQ